MPVLHIEHAITDLATWKAALDYDVGFMTGTPKPQSTDKHR